MAFFKSPQKRTRPSPDLECVVPVSPEPPADPQGAGWLVSSFDLRQGLDVSESPLDTLPVDLFAELQPVRPAPDEAGGHSR